MKNIKKSDDVKSAVKLPRLIIKEFDGDVLEWNSFIDSFKAAVHESTITDVEKFNYLRGYLKGAALKTVDGLLLCNENYEKALELLEQPYGNQEVIISKHVKHVYH